jgi:hypothetical protein
MINYVKCSGVVAVLPPPQVPLPNPDGNSKLIHHRLHYLHHLIYPKSLKAVWTLPRDLAENMAPAICWVPPQSLYVDLIFFLFFSLTLKSLYYTLNNPSPHRPWSINTYLVIPPTKFIHILSSTCI